MIKRFSLIALWIFSVSSLISITANAQATKLFDLLPASETEVDFVNTLEDSQTENILIYANFYGGAGVGVIDINNDGLQDLFFAGNLVANELYLNQGDLKFKKITKEAGIEFDGGWSTGVTIADVNNDGFQDIYVSRELYDDKPELRKNLLYINNQDNTFTERGAEYGVADDERTRHATFFDYDKDGFLDLLLLTQPPNPGSYSIFSGTELRKEEYHLKLFKNNSGTSFTETSEQAGVSITGFPNAVSASDFDNDGWTDLYVANDFAAPDFLFINNQDGTFSYKTEEALQHIPYYSMGVDAADLNNDNLLDVFVVDMVAKDNYRLKSNMSGMNPKSFWKVVSDGGYYQYMYNTLQLNNGNGSFSDIGQYTGMAATDWSWANLIADFDNDGLKDTYVTNGLLRDIRNTDADKEVAAYINKLTHDWVLKHPDGGGIKTIFDILDVDKVVELIPSQPLKNFAFKNTGNLDFIEVQQEWGLDQASFSNGASYVDLDNDGDLDIVVNNINAEAFIYRNNSDHQASSNYLRIKPLGKNNLAVLGARVSVYVNGDTQMQELTNVRGIYSTSEQVAHFGLGASTSVDSVIVSWPNGKQVRLKNVEANQQLSVSDENAQDGNSIYSFGSTNDYFEDITSEFPIKLKTPENDYDDFEEQVLLPHKLSQFGPAMAKGDINNDGLEDIYIGGAAGFSGSIYIQQTNGSFKKLMAGVFKNDASQEDLDAVFADVNRDGFQDLVVVSGGNEEAKGSDFYMDRYYENDTKGSFIKKEIENALTESGSKVIAADYEGDGDIDFFIGGRITPHEYPLPATSQLLVNENGKLTNLTEELAPQFKNLGLVTDAVWSDVDADGDLDLLVVGEWMTITYFENEDGRLTKKEIVALAETSGWWFSIEKGDFDNDGDEDFIIGNLGANYKYQTTLEKPFDIYYDDFDNNGKGDIVLGYYNGDGHFPLRGFSCSSEQIPSLKKEIKQYNIFASLEIDEVYGKKDLERSLHYTADTFNTIYLENTGDNFKVHKLPTEVQLAPINDIIVQDFNKDGNLDALLAGNLFVSEIETPRADSGTGVLLLGDGTGAFKVQTSKDSGFFANGDVKRIVPLQVQGKEIILVGNNNAKVQAFELKK
ncbi:VCBS repeat protein [Leeuwenhoekiella aestuarii]|uniref:VCBS repeat protein n=1 Tax=Leeuwenhoekiella aestuarii TaxID=2249426 RepID=A0A4V1KPP0_9FLAO|nr:VCBS repeat-containing protein [Leeuwenhoekiella aestuarii]RXG16071.1 VCBS repeat protein [Leeuwenhoekiella aestuarii]RXG16765.1 VCBS repeat protein [Leeuwenhoekiella aestuarii]